jgi:hypothetical protein
MWLEVLNNQPPYTFVAAAPLSTSFPLDWLDPAPFAFAAFAAAAAAAPSASWLADRIISRLCSRCLKICTDAELVVIMLRPASSVKKGPMPMAATAADATRMSCGDRKHTQAAAAK